MSIQSTVVQATTPLTMVLSSFPISLMLLEKHQTCTSISLLVIILKAVDKVKGTNQTLEQ
jgi:hypothetical protein